jgi:NitT/TauT family transport system ATP-binding protein
MAPDQPGDNAAERHDRQGELVIENVSKWFRTGWVAVQALDGINLHIRPGEFVCLVGPSGCGKSTLLDIVAGLTRPDSGSVAADGMPVTGPQRHRLVMFQESALFPWLNALGNVLFGLKLVPELTRGRRRQIAMDYLRLVRLERFAHANVHELSGGMRQRVSLARALAPDPRVLLMDEPFSALDALTRERLYDDLQEIWSKRRKTILLVTHDVREAVCLADRVLLFSSHPGQLREAFDVPLPRPRNVNDPALSAHVIRITTALKSYVMPQEVL